MASKVNWAGSNFTELHELCGILSIRLDFDPHRDLCAIVVRASNDEEIFIRLTCPKALYSTSTNPDSSCCSKAYCSVTHCNMPT